MASSLKTTQVEKKKNNQKNEDQLKEDMIVWFNSKRLPLFGTVIVTTLVIIALFGLLGWYIDSLLDTKPIFLIILVIISFPVTQLILYRKIKTMIRNKKQSANQ